MRNYNWVLLLLLICNYFPIHASESSLLYGQEAVSIVPDAEQVRVDEETELPSFVQLKKESRLPFNEAFKYIFELYNLESDYSFELIDKQEFEGEKHLRYKQYFNGFPIRHAHLVLHLDNTGRLSSFNGNIIRGSFNKSTAEISKKDALKKCLNDVSALIYKWELPSEERFIKWEQKDSSATFYPKATLTYISNDLSFLPENQRLTYQFDIYAHTPLSRQLYYVDVESGEIVFKESKIKHGGNSRGTGHTAYNGAQTIISDSLAAVFRLRDSTRGNGVLTFDMNNSRQYSSAQDFLDSNNVWDTFNPAIDQYAIDAHWGTEMTFDYFDSTHNRNSIDNNGFALKSYIHYDINYANAFWDGHRMTYGDGNATTSPLTTLDITGHEIAHGWTDFTSDLIYANESGALNESFSDIIGVLIEFYATPSSANWLIGEDIGRAIRSMSNPNFVGDPDTYGGLNWVNQNCIPSSSNDRCGVHTNSGVQNYWFYLLVNGGLGVNDIGDSINVNGIGMDKAAKIAFRTNTIYLTPSSNYSDARFYSFRSAVDLYGACSAEVEDVINAWHGVGVGEAYKDTLNADFVALNDTSFCSVPVTVTFVAKSSNIYNYSWNFGDGNFSSARTPTHTYSNFGDYSVRFVAEGLGCGSDSLLRINYINIDSTYDCSTILNGRQTLTNNCSGVFYDAGGLNGNYPVSQIDTLTVEVSSADFIRFYFDSVDIEQGYKGRCNHDFIEIFDGVNPQAQSLGRFCNNNIPDSIQSSSSSITLVFYSDRMESRGGIRGRWSCFQSTSNPFVDFTASVDTSCNGVVQFSSSITNGYKQLVWDFGDGSQSFEANPEHTYLQDGDYDVSLIASNSLGEDTLIKQKLVYINRGTAPTVQNDTSCLGGDHILKAFGAPELLWYNGSRGDNAVHKGDSLNIQNRSTSISYYVESSPTVQSINNVPFAMSGATYYSDTSESIYFNVQNTLIFEFFMAKVSRRTEIRIDLFDSTGSLVYSKLTQVSPPISQVNLDFLIFPGNNYELSIGSREPGLMVNESGATYPYTFGNIMSIDSSSLGLNGFPFFYYIDVKPIRCASMRSRVTAFVDTNCVITDIPENKKETDGFSVFPNPFTNEVSIEFPSNENSLEMMIFDSRGTLVFHGKLSDNQQKLNLSFLNSKGVYFLKAVGELKTYHQKLIKH